MERMNEKKEVEDSNVKTKATKVVFHMMKKKKTLTSSFVEH